MKTYKVAISKKLIRYQNHEVTVEAESEFDAERKAIKRCTFVTDPEFSECDIVELEEIKNENIQSNCST